MTLFPVEEHALQSCSLFPLQEEAEAASIAEALAGQNPWRAMDIPAHGLRQYLLRPDPCLFRFSIRVENETAGVIALRHPWLRGPYLELLGLLTAWQGKGHGAKVLQWADRRIAHAGGRNLWAMVSAFNADARRFYRKQGFEEIAVVPDLVRDGYDEVMLRKRIAGPGENLPHPTLSEGTTNTGHGASCNNRSSTEPSNSL